MPLIQPDKGVNLQALLKRFALIFLPVAIVFTIVLFSIGRLVEQRQIEKIEGRASSRVELARALLAQDFDAADADLRVIASLPALRNYLDDGSPAHHDELAGILLVLARESRRYDQIRYLDSAGKEVLRINYNDGQPAIVPADKLQDKSGRYYFRDMLRLDPGEVYVSPLDLNIEQDGLEIPYKPTIRFGTLLADSAGRKKGVLVFNYLGANLLRDFRKATGGDEHTDMLLNRDGYWLSGPKPEDEWGFMLGRSDRTFGRDFFEEWRSISIGEAGMLRTAKGLFVYSTVYPLRIGQHSSTGAGLANAPSGQELTTQEYCWKIVSFVPDAVLSEAIPYNQTSIRKLLLSVYVLLALAAWVIALVTESRKHVRFELARSKARYDELAQRIPVGVYLLRFDVDGSMRFEYVSPVFCQILGLDADAVLHDAGAAFAAVHPDDLDSLVHSNSEVAVSLKPYRWEGRFIVRGETRWIRIASDPTAEPGEGIRWSGVVSDITGRKQMEDELKRQARIDVLTGLNNRRHFFELAEQELARAKRHGEPLSVLMLDVDHFKLFNDTYGHQIGDLVLQKLSEVCLNILREIDRSGRIGGEEFAILLPETTDDQALEVAERLRSAIAGAAVPLEQGGAVKFTVSIGIASLAATDTSVDDILKRADAAMYAAKSAGRNRVCGEVHG